MKRPIFALALASLALAAPAAIAREVVKDKKTCAQAVTDARDTVKEGSVSEKIRVQANDLITISEHLCTQANFVYADKSLAIVRGMVAEE